MRYPKIELWSLLSCFVILISLTFTNVTLAANGCCKIRKSADHPWEKKDMDIAACKAENKKEEDNIFKNAGNVRWDTSC